MQNDFGTRRAPDATTSKTILFLDSASPGTLLFTLLLLVSINIVQVIASLRGPPLVSSREDRVALGERATRGLAELDLVVANLQERHAFILVTCSLIRRRSTSKDGPFIVDSWSRVTFSKNSTPTTVVDIPRTTHQLSFAANSLISSAFAVLRREVIAFDALDVQLSLSGAVDKLQNASFTSSFANPAAIKYVRSVRGRMSCLVVFMLFIFCFFLVFGVDVFTQTFCLVLGLAALFGANPVAIAFPSASSEVLSDHLLVATYTNVFRLFCIVQFELMRCNKAAPNPLVFLGLGVFFGFAVTIEASASIERMRHPIADALDSDRVRLAVTSIYAIIAALWVTLGIVKSKSDTVAKRVLVFGFFLAADLLIVLVTQLRVVRGVTHTVLQSTVPISMGAFAIFLLHTTQRQQYQQMEVDTDIGGALDVEELSPAGKQGFGEDEEDFIDEEEYFEEDLE
jgi:hypothetical protein